MAYTFRAQDGANTKDEDNQAGAPSQRTVAPSQRTVAPSQRTIAPSQRTVGESQRTVALSQRTVGPSQSTVGASQRTVGESQRTVALSQRTVGPSQSTVGASQRTTGPAPSQRTVGASQRTSSGGAQSQRTVGPSSTTRTGSNSGFRPSQMANRSISEEPAVDYSITSVNEEDYQPAATFSATQSRGGQQQGQLQLGGGIAPTFHVTPGQPSQTQFQQSQSQSQSQYQPSQSGYQASQRNMQPSVSSYQPSQSSFQQSQATTVGPSIRPAAGKSLVIRPGEPHHYGTKIDNAVGRLNCTLCRCRTPMAHGDAYTMLSSPRGIDIQGFPIDWQTAKNRMLDYYNFAEQITHDQEIEAIPYIFDQDTAAAMLKNEEEIRDAAKDGRGVSVNAEGNMVNWHNEGERRREDVTEGGLKTRRNY